MLLERIKVVLGNKTKCISLQKGLNDFCGTTTSDEVDSCKWRYALCYGVYMLMILYFCQIVRLEKYEYGNMIM